MQKPEGSLHKAPRRSMRQRAERVGECVAFDQRSVQINAQHGRAGCVRSCVGLRKAHRVHSRVDLVRGCTRRSYACAVSVQQRNPARDCLMLQHVCLWDGWQRGFPICRVRLRRVGNTFHGQRIRFYTGTGPVDRLDPCCTPGAETFPTRSASCVGGVYALPPANRPEKICIRTSTSDHHAQHRDPHAHLPRTGPSSGHVLALRWPNR